MPNCLAYPLRLQKLCANFVIQLINLFLIYLHPYIYPLGDHDLLLEYMFCSNMTTFRSYLNYSYLYRDAFGKVTNLTKLLGHNKFCEDICPNECNQISYTVTSYYAINYQSHAMVNIYYEDFTFTEISQIPKITSDSLFAMFGNIFGKIICSWFYSQIYSFLYIKAVLVDCFQA